MRKLIRTYCLFIGIRFDFKKVCFSRGKLIKLLISSNIGRYLEFKVVGDTFIHSKNTIREVLSLFCVVVVAAVVVVIVVVVIIIVCVCVCIYVNVSTGMIVVMVMFP